ncbi:hypothetical protein [Alteromonas lipolytica]|uniref:Uncharacterized protein n=1 Tax=Alteromonas lipolytica TaxID=1856405 RepID=A0A1E8FFV0_9ALTE|nr:hypothetical protein [Alteromonas lipolytica]OFI34800.1 hypothetical protein BFC17_14585 [Alteromonas lipolytica]GGF54117.1 hypothetical protein GCM10011338_02840 [Alteromonas lipolytica]
MNKSESKLNKQISKHYVDHACNISSPGQVAKELNLDPSRISELRGARRLLTIEQAEIIKEMYGIPSNSTSYWLEGERTTLEALGIDFIDNGLKLHFCRILELFNTDTFIDRVLSNIYVNEKGIPEFKETSLFEQADINKSIEQKNKRLIKEHKIKMFNLLLSSEHFQQWCDSAATLLGRDDIQQDDKFFGDLLMNKDIRKAVIKGDEIQWGSTDSNPVTLPLILASIEKGFYLSFSNVYQNRKEAIGKFIAICRFKQLVESKSYANILPSGSTFIFGKKLGMVRNNMPVKEYVIVGKCVWDHEEQLGTKIRLNNPIKTKSVVKLSRDEGGFELNPDDQLVPETIRYLNVRLFYTEQFNYVAEIQTFSDNFKGCDRSILVEFEERHKVFDGMIEILKYFTADFHFTIKQIKGAVAANGGYIPSAIYID